MRRVRLRPSPALVIAVIALFLALGGAAYAGFKIGTQDIQNGAVTRAKLANGAVTREKRRRDSVTGLKLDESTLGQVPSAQTANQANTANRANQADAVNGLSLRKFAARATAGSAPGQAATVGSLSLQFGCTASGKPIFKVLPASAARHPAAHPTGTAVDETVRSSVILDGVGATKGQGQGTLPATGITVLDGTEDSIGSDGTVEALTENGDVTTVQWSARSTSVIPSANPQGLVCLFFGTGISG